MFNLLLTYINAQNFVPAKILILVIAAVSFYYIFKGIELIFKIIFYIILIGVFFYFFKDIILSLFAGIL